MPLFFPSQIRLPRINGFSFPGRYKVYKLHPHSYRALTEFSSLIPPHGRLVFRPEQRCSVRGLTLLKSTSQAWWFHPLLTGTVECGSRYLTYRGGMTASLETWQILWIQGWEPVSSRD
ncbi:hypothetical protein PISMIDRAFT_431029 [Pisolithus microcarpus 441]|uniref:Uncharacterized protein n=1 Tax=Pisolithus microcarpus 441 TaxID=765257 RepID=A0A0C9ZNA3_9AGAM|nr:hypothetical protein PISMIDRAFT_431029 [Pisolithus microcarpus 441]